MVDEERDVAEDDYEGPRRKTYTPPDADAVYTGALPIIDEDIPPVPSPVPPVSAPRAPTDPPVRTSLSDDEILSKFSSGTAGSTQDMMAELEKQVSLREEEEEAFEMWANLTRATRGEDADTIIARERIIFDGGTPEPEPELEPEPVMEEEGPVEPLEESLPREETEDPVSDISSTELDNEDEDDDDDEDDEDEDDDDEDDDDDDDEDDEDEDDDDDDDDDDEDDDDDVEDDDDDDERKAAPAQSLIEPDVRTEVARRTGGLWGMWAAVAAPAVALVAGAFLVARGLGFWASVVAMLSAGLITGLLVAAIARAGHLAGRGTASGSTLTFGRVGAFLPAVLLALVGTGVVATVSLFAGSLIAELVESARWFQAETWIIQAAGAGVIVLLATALASVGGQVLRVGLWVSASLAGLGFIALVVYTTLSIPLQSLTGWDTPTIEVIGAGVLLLSGLLVLVAMGAADLTNVKPSCARSFVGGETALGSLVPLVLLMIVSAALATGSTLRAPVLAGNPVFALAGDLPLWFPIPVILVLILPLVGLLSLALTQSGTTLQSLVAPLPRVASPIIVALLAAALSGVVIALEIPVAGSVPDVLTTVGVVLAAWAGVVGVDAALGWWRTEEKAVRPALVLGFIVAIAAGLGLVASSIPWLSWQGYLFPLLESAGLIDLSAAQPGVLVALVLSALVSAGAHAARASKVAERD